MKAVHFGAGNIGRGFVGLLLSEGGYELVFSDVAAPLIDALNAADSYTVREAGPGGTDTVVTGFRAMNSATHPTELIAEIATADVVTTAVGPTILRFVAPPIVAALEQRDPSLPPLQVMACENAINATDLLRAEVEQVAGDRWVDLSGLAVFANTAVDRIVPGQPADGGIDVTVEPFFEWVIESEPFGDQLPSIPRAHFVSDLAPFIERKLFTVNTGHAAAAYLGAREGVERISDALAIDSVRESVSAALAETSAVLAKKYALTPDDLRAYREKIIARFLNPELPDTVARVGREPLRKLSRHERFIGPAAEAAERGLSVDALLTAVAAALEFDDPDDAQSVQLQADLRAASDPNELTTTITGLEPEHPLFAGVAALVARRRDSLAN